MLDVFSCIETGKCVYTKLVDGDCVIMCLYVDDIHIFCTSLDIVHKTKFFFASKFDMKDMREASVILGVKIIRNDGSIIQSQEHYVEKLPKKFGLYNVTLVITLYDANTQLRKNRGDLVAQSKYAQIIGSLMHLMNFS